MKKSLLIRIFSSLLVTSLAAVGLSAPAQASGSFLVEETGAMTAGVARTFAITATSDGTTPIPNYSISVTLSSTDDDVEFGTLSPFDPTTGVATVDVTFSAAGIFTVTASTTGPSALVGTSASIGVAGFDIETTGTVTAGVAKTFGITATSNGTTPIANFAGAVVFSSNNAGATFGTLSAFNPTTGVATVDVTFSAAGSFTVTATETGGALLVGTSQSISVAATDSVALFAAVVAYVDADIGTPTTANVTAANNLRVTVQGLLNELVEGGVAPEDIGEAQNPVNVKTAVVAQAAAILYQALPLSTLAEVTAAETFGLVTQDLVTAMLTFGFGTQDEESAKLDSQTKVDTKDGLVAAARLALTPAASAPSRPVDDGAWQQNLQTIPTPVPGFFSGQKWTITKDDDGVSTVWISLAESHAGKTAKIYKRTIKGKLFLLGEQRLGKIGENARTVLETDKPLRTGQKVRVQVDGTFRSTVTMP